MTTSIRKPWSRDDLLAAMHLYFLLPFGKLSQTTPAIQELAIALGRTSSSVAMKLCNFASLDPQIIASGRKGLDGASKADQALWMEFQKTPSQFIEQTATSLEQKMAYPSGPTQVQRTIQARRGQDFFRSTVLQSYGSTCAFSGLDAPELLRASHIIPWSEHEETRLDPTNGICLNALHDAAFDRNLITLDCRSNQIMQQSA